MTSPYVRRLRLAAELRNLRTRAGLTHEELAKETGQSRAQISRLENAHVVDQKDVINILDALGADEGDWARILGIARDAGERGWWEAHKSLGDRQAFYADLEAGARRICEFHMAFVPGLLQTPEYTRARAESDYLTQGFAVSAADAAEACRLRQRMVRNGPEYEVILDEVAVTRLAVPPEVTKAQLYHIGALANAVDTYRVQVLPSDAVIDGYAMPRSSFSIYTFEDPDDPDVVVVDTITEDLVRTGDAYVQRYLELFARLQDAAMSVDETVDFLMAAAAEIRDQ